MSNESEGSGSASAEQTSYVIGRSPTCERAVAIAKSAKSTPWMLDG